MRKWLIITALMVATTGARAQVAKGTFTVQPQVGVTVSTLADMQSYDLGGMKLDNFVNGGMLFGVEFAYQLYDVVSIAAGINWSQQGTAWQKYDMSGRLQNVLQDEALDQVSVKNLRVRNKVETGYITLPLTASVYLYKGLAIKAGVQLGILTNADEMSRFKGDGMVEGRGIDFNMQFSRSLYEDCQKLDLSIPIGISYEFKVPIVVDARYNIGVTRVNKEQVEGDKDWKNGVFRVTVGYKFKL